MLVRAGAILQGLETLTGDCKRMDEPGSQPGTNPTQATTLYDLIGPTIPLRHVTNDSE